MGPRAHVASGRGDYFVRSAKRRLSCQEKAVKVALAVESRASRDTVLRLMHEGGDKTRLQIRRLKHSGTNKLGIQLHSRSRKKNCTIGTGGRVGIERRQLGRRGKK